MFIANSIHQCDDLRSHSWILQKSTGLFPLNDFLPDLSVQVSVFTEEENFHGRCTVVIRKLQCAYRNKVHLNGERKHIVNLHFTLKLRVYSRNPWPYYQRLEEDNEILNKALNKWRFSLNYEWIHAYYYRGVLMSLLWGLCQNFHLSDEGQGDIFIFTITRLPQKRSLIKLNPIPKQRDYKN